MTGVLAALIPDARQRKLVAGNFKKLYIEQHKLRTGRVMWQQVETHVMPKLGPKDFNAIIKHPFSPR
ncbi:hypothetical protein IVA95_29075 [Bradyrhizobium sp. 157]|uniref:hypothetical protein n=1 Tax=Bradyrhizobium sp. 157 TaxID=2782631 RepID=UPI001FF748F5|nr:hypothetical protein [Bradyrhizobium sp. 157]MCK1641490.1 hypothetical protein [Bradyrhizobium sp. 157]